MVPEDKIQEFVKRTREAGGANIEAIILFGSAVAGEFHPGLSDLNLLCVLRDSAFTALQALAPVAKWWAREKQPAPLCMTRHELERSTDVFTIELLDMVQHHRILVGEDVLNGLRIQTHLHRVQVEYELREKLLLLRQRLLLADNAAKQLDVLMHSVSSFTTLFRHALIALGADAPSGRREATEALAQVAGFDGSAIQQVLDLRERNAHSKNINAAELCGRYVATVEKVAAAVDKALDSQASGVK